MIGPLQLRTFWLASESLKPKKNATLKATCGGHKSSAMPVYIGDSAEWKGLAGIYLAESRLFVQVSMTAAGEISYRALGRRFARRQARCTTSAFPAQVHYLRIAHHPPAIVSKRELITTVELKALQDHWSKGLLCPERTISNVSWIAVSGRSLVSRACPPPSKATRMSHGPDEIHEYASVVVLQIGQVVGEVGEVVAHARLQVLANMTIDGGQRAAPALT